MAVRTKSRYQPVSRHWLPDKVIKAIKERDNYTCLYCGVKVVGFNCTLDHVVCRAEGGTDEASNLVVACRSCNSRRRALRVAAFVRKVAAELGLVVRTILRRIKRALQRPLAL